MRKLGLFLVLIGCLAAVPPAMAVECPDGKKEVVIVTIDIGESITVTPPTAEIWMETESRPAGKPMRVCWVVNGLEKGMTVHMGSKKEGPGLFSDPIYRIKGTRDDRSTSTGKARSSGHWDYSVWVTRTGESAPLKLVDPVIIINEGIGGGGRP